MNGNRQKILPDLLGVRIWMATIGSELGRRVEGPVGRLDLDAAFPEMSGERLPRALGSAHDTFRVSTFAVALRHRNMLADPLDDTLRISSTTVQDVAQLPQLGDLELRFQCTDAPATQASRLALHELPYCADGQLSCQCLPAITVPQHETPDPTHFR